MEGFAVLSWANAELGIDGLSAQDVQALMSKRRVKRSYQAYSGAFNNRIAKGEIDTTGNKPTI